MWTELLKNGFLSFFPLRSCMRLRLKGLAEYAWSAIGPCVNNHRLIADRTYPTRPLSLSRMHVRRGKKVKKRSARPDIGQFSKVHASKHHSADLCLIKQASMAPLQQHSAKRTCASPTKLNSCVTQSVKQLCSHIGKPQAVPCCCI